MKLRSLPVLILALLGIAFMFYVAMASKDCDCNKDHSKKNTVGAVAATAAAATLPKKVTGPVLFKRKSAIPQLGKGWEAEKAKYTNLKDNHKLRITGYYEESEGNNTSYENLGIARAHEIAKKFAPEISDDRIIKVGEVRKGLADKDIFVATDFVDIYSSDRIQEVDGKALFYFPKNSTKKISDPEHEAYLTNVAKKVNAEGGKVKLTGHTDSDGNADSNMRLGQGRADIIKEYLVSKGLSADKIVATSMGENDPMVPNDSNANKAKNRRTELEIIK